METEELLGFLAEHEAVLTNQHFRYTSNGHGPAYINMRVVGHLAPQLMSAASDMSTKLKSYGIDMVIGPETLGRTLAGYVGANLGLPALWCDIVEEDGKKKAVFNEKLNFGRLVAGKKFAIVDDLLTTGGSVRAVSELIKSLGGEVVVTVVVVRRSPDVGAEDCGSAHLETLLDVEGFAVYTPEECADHGPCSEKVPMVPRPGHGYKWLEENPGYPSA